MLKSYLNIMLRGFIPFVLASLGFAIILWADGMSMFEWQISEIVTDFSSHCDYQLPPSHWTTRLGESLDLTGRYHSVENLNVVVTRSRTDEILDRISLALYNNVSWLFVWGVLEVILSINYIWQFLLQDKQKKASHIVMAIFLTAIALCIGLWFLASHGASLAGPAVGWHFYYFAEDCRGTVTFSAELLKLHYETPAILFAGILMELGALSVIVRQKPITATFSDD